MELNLYKNTKYYIPKRAGYPPTDFEKEVVTLKSKGYKNLLIASLLNIDTRTLDNKIRIMLEKYNCLNSTALVAHFLRKEFIK